jgi:predicted Rossmann fold nucleotide-binding protein DprA/Smf involved in DNA uptake
MKIGVVGSRRRKDVYSVINFIDTLNPEDIIISGGCRGVDSWAEQRSKERGLQTIIFKPDLTDIKHRGDMIKRYYDRNKQIAEACDVLVAFVSLDRTGGTENTIGYASELGKKIIIMEGEKNETKEKHG